MELYDGVGEQKKSQVPMIIGICIAILLVITVLIICGIIYLKSSITTVQIDGVRNSEIEEIFYFESNDEGQQLYMPILRTAKFLNYEGYNGDYKDKSEDKTKCHVTNENETAMFTLKSNMLIKINNETEEKEYIQLDKEVFEINGELYTTVEGIEKAFNVMFYSDENYKNIDIFTMEYLIQYYATKLNLEEYTASFSDQKAIFENMLIIEENNKYGVINATSGESILETKYEQISYLPATTDFIVKSNNKYGIVSKNAEIKIKTVYDEIKTIDYQKGLYLVKQNNAYGIVTLTGTVVIAPEYKQIGIDSQKYSQNGVDNKYILLDEIIPVQNTEGLWGLFNTKGNKIVDFKYTSIGCQSTPISNSYPTVVIPSHKIIVVQKDQKYNLVTLQGEELIEGYILDSVYIKINAETEENEFYMTANNNTKVMNVEEWLTNMGK